MKKVNRVTIIDMPWWYKIWQHSGYNPTRAKQELLTRPRRACKCSWNPTRKPKVIYTDNLLGICSRPCEELSWNHCTSTPHRSETNGIAERAVRRIKKGTSAVLLQSGLDENWWADSMEYCCSLRTFKISCLMGRHQMKDALEKPFKGPIIPFGSTG